MLSGMLCPLPKGEELDLCPVGGQTNGRSKQAY